MATMNDSITFREQIVHALKCRQTTTYGINCKTCPYGARQLKRYCCDIPKLCEDVLKLMEMNDHDKYALAKEIASMKAQMLAAGVSFK